MNASKILEALKQFWLAPTTATSLAVLRILFGVLLCQYA